MARHENTRLKNLHTLYLARSGHGKSQALKRRSGIAAAGQRVVLWDTNKDHDAHRFDKPALFFRALSRAHQSGKGFRIAYTGEGGNIDLFEDVCAAVWNILDGRTLTHFIAEEYGAACEGPGPIQLKRHPFHKRLWQEGRKYGLVWHATSQRPQSISKDSIENAGRIWAGGMGMNAAKRIGQEIDVDFGQLRDITPGDFFRWEPAKQAEKIHVFTPK
ncbi:hypothetical protein [Teredinibacter turnerae]|uniref:Uncharacterized protein n=1 Tax=Teredinibacter turnerae (strain ATCC 39867 / T7901) TaxID=377629 RepID=C5BSN5_TERTT|nr:hypothetical protein [Teredinibacter turnerae]ACR13858.1 conserved hypothetical protein [Teredinibacter turnerae T7901]